jgi:hypothetical protein
MPTVPEIITESILKQLEQGVAPWRKPWSTSVPRNLISKKPYRGLNLFLLATQGYGSPYWVTFNQAKHLGAHVRQGEKSTLVSFWKFNEYAKENRETGETENKTSVLLRYYRVFNIEQCDGLKALHGDDHSHASEINRYCGKCTCTDFLGGTMETQTQDRTAWRLAALAVSLGTSVGFLRNEIRRGALVARKCGRAVIVLESDLRTYLDQRRVKPPVRLPRRDDSNDR